LSQSWFATISWAEEEVLHLAGLTRIGVETQRDVKDGEPEDATREVEQIKAFRDTWEWGIHSYLAYLRDRLTVARDLLTESGSVFVQIGDETSTSYAVC
jgi:hypothetical protein